MTDEERELIAAAKHYVKISQNHDMSPYIKENGRRWCSPWAELVAAVNESRS